MKEAVDIEGLDHAVRLFKDYIKGKGGFDELDLKEYIIDTYSKSPTAIQAEITKAVIEELNELYDEAEEPSHYDTCEVVHAHRIAYRLAELQQPLEENK